jgi:hypothetical protein
LLPPARRVEARHGKVISIIRDMALLQWKNISVKAKAPENTFTITR